MGQTVLVVEDDSAIVEFVQIALEEAGYRVEAAMGAAAPAVAHALRPDVILLDLHMPGMDGSEVSRCLRADPATAGIPIVVMSAHLSWLGGSASLPVNATLAKPFSLAALYRTVARWTSASDESGEACPAEGVLVT